jgi:hypothetical protein
LRDLAPKQGAREERPIEEQCAADALAAEKRAVDYQFTRNNEEREMLKLGLVKPNSYPCPYAMPPGVPRDRVRAMEAAFLKTLKDPEFVAEAEKTRMTFNSTPGTHCNMTLIGDSFSDY